MFVDLLGAPDDAANEALECLCKATAGPEDASIWALHPSPFLQTLVESFTDNGLKVSGAMADEVMRWLTGKMFTPKYVGAPSPAPYPWHHSELASVHAYLAGKLPQDMTFTDWSMLGDYLVSVHMPPSFAQQHASWMAARAGVMGRLEAQLPALPGPKASNALASLPSTVEQALASFTFTPAQMAAMQFAQANCANAIVAASDSLRSGIKSAILQEMVQPHRPGVPSESLQTKLLDRFGMFNRDWRRIAVTEAGEAKNQGFIASLPVGARVRRLEQYNGACPFCKKLHGKEFIVASPDDPKKDGKKHVWVGKSNLGRSASPNKIVDGKLISRTEDELWWPAAGLQHPHCRGMWMLLTAAPSTEVQDDVDWGAWLGAIGLV